MATVGVNFADHVRSVLARRFPGAEVVDVVRLDGAQRVSGFIVWAGFKDEEQIDRQRKIHATLREELGAEAMNISIILAYSPEEWKAMHEDE